MDERKETISPAGSGFAPSQLADFRRLEERLSQLKTHYAQLRQPTGKPGFWQRMIGSDPKEAYIRKLNAAARSLNDTKKQIRFHPVTLNRVAALRKSVPVTVTAPIVTDAVLGAQPLLDLIRSLENNDNVAVAEAEARRLAPYMAGFSLYLTSALPAARKERQNLRDLSTPQALTGLFNAMAKKTHSTLISEVALLPDNIKRCGPASPLFQGREFSQSYRYGKRDFNFGFVQVYDRGRAKDAYFSTTLPVFLISHRMLGRLAPYGAANLLKSFQRVMTSVNHDMLHHYTSPVIGQQTSAQRDYTGSLALNRWLSNLPAREDGRSLYEAWAMATHEKIFLTPGNEAMVAELQAEMVAYFVQLERLRDAMAAKEISQKVRDTVDYFGMLMAHALARVFPLGHPVMDACMNNIEHLDPAPERALSDAAQLLGGPSGSMAPVLGLHAIRIHFQTNKRLSGIIKSYQSTGLDLLPERDRDWGYRTVKRLQLCDCSPGEVEAHAPEPASPRLHELRRNADKTTLAMLLAAARASGFTPS